MGYEIRAIGTLIPGASTRSGCTTRQLSRWDTIGRTIGFVRGVSLCKTII